MNRKSQFDSRILSFVRYMDWCRGPHPPAQMGFRGSFPKCKVARARSYSVKLKNYWSYTSTSPMYLDNTVLKQARENYAFLFALLELAVFYSLDKGYCT